MSKRFLCRIGFHQFGKGKLQRTKNMGFGGWGLPIVRGLRLVRKCELCGHTRYSLLTVQVPYKYLHKHEVWE